MAWTLFGLAESLAVLFLARLLAGAMGGNVATAQAYVADVTPPEARAGAGDDPSRESRLRRLADALSTRGLGALVASFFLASFAFSALESQFIYLRPRLDAVEIDSHRWTN